MRRIKSKIGRPSPSMAVALAALIVALGGVAMAAPSAIQSVLNKKEKKQTKNIAKNQINKLAPGLSVARAAKADDANALGGQTLANIVTARSATPGGQCDPTSTAFINCATVDLTLPHEGRVLLVGTAGQIAFNNANASGTCLFRVDGVNSGGAVLVGNQSLPNVTGAAARGFPDGFANTVVTAPVSAGAHTFGIACQEATADVEFQGPQISAVMVGSG
jgi:hypothetical protein